jgi:hypothetical protein
MKTLNIKGFKFHIEDSDYAAVKTAGPWFVLIGKRKVSARHNVTVDGVRTQQYLGQFLMNPPEGKVVAYMDNNPMNNSRDNLAIATHAQVLAKQRLRLSTTTGFKGVTTHSNGGYSAYLDGHYISHHTTAEAAAHAYDRAAIAKYGKFATTNFPVGD